MKGAVGCLILIVMALILALLARDYFRSHPQDAPWKPLRLDDPIGYFTARKLAEFRDSPGQCRALLGGGRSGDVPAPPRRAPAPCGYEDGMRIGPSKPEAIRYRPAGLVTSCPVAAALEIFERQIVQAAARRHLGAPVTAIDHAGSYSCRRLYGRSEGAYSEHATANAVDITAFRVADGRQISVLRDWDSDGPEAAFLHEVRDGGCRLFATVLSPDYNEAHRDHLHFDQARRGGGWTLCR